MKKIIFTGLLVMCVTSALVAHPVSQPNNSSIAPTRLTSAGNLNVNSALKVDMDVTINGKTYHVKGDIKISIKDKSATMDISITTPDGKTLRFNGTVYLTNGGANVITGVLTDEDGKIIPVSDYRELLEEIANQLLQEDISFIDGTMTNEDGDTIDIAPYADLLLQIANQILQGEQ